MKPELHELAQGFSLLSSSTRLSILKRCAKGPKNVTALCKALKVKQPTLSHHISLLRLGRLLNSVRRGKSVLYATDEANLKALAAAVPRLLLK